MEFGFHDGTIRDVVFLEDSVNRYLVLQLMNIRLSSGVHVSDEFLFRTSLLVSGGAGNCHLHVTDCHTGQMVQSMRGHNGR